MKAIVTLLAATLALTGCANVTGPEEQHDADARLVAAKRSLEAATKESGPTLKLAAN